MTQTPSPPKGIGTATLTLAGIAAAFGVVAVVGSGAVGYGSLQAEVSTHDEEIDKKADREEVRVIRDDVREIRRDVREILKEVRK